MSNQTAPPVSTGNPMAMDGLEFVEFAAPDPSRLGEVFQRMGFRAAGRHRSKAVTLYRQGDINLIINAELDSLPESFAAIAEPAVCAIAFRVADAGAAYRRALSLGAWDADAQAGMMELRIPAIAGVGDTTIYLIDRYGDHSIYDVDFRPLTAPEAVDAGVGLQRVHEIGHGVRSGRSNEWVGFYAHLFGFSDLDGLNEATGRLLLSPCGKVHIRMTESPGAEVEGSSEGIFAITLATADIRTSLEALESRGIGSAPQGRLQTGLTGLQFALVEPGGDAP